MTTRIGPRRHSTHQTVRIDPRATPAGDPPSLQQQLTEVMTNAHRHVNTLNDHIAALRQRVERLERTRR
jgi:hypothetical protein